MDLGLVPGVTASRTRQRYRIVARNRDGIVEHTRKGKSKATLATDRTTSHAPAVPKI